MDFRIEDGYPYAAEAAELLAAVFVSSEMLDALNDRREWRVAVNSEGVVGFICWERCLEYLYWDLSWLAVSGDVRGQGVGKALVDQLKAEVVAQGGRSIRVETPCDSEARGFYEAQGFTLACILPDYYEPDRGVCIYVWHYS